MAEYHVDCRAISCGKAMHQTLAKTLSFPGWYGANLDALYDCLTDLHTETVLHLHNWQACKEFCAGFLQVLEDAAEHNPHFSVYLYEEKDPG